MIYAIVFIVQYFWKGNPKDLEEKAENEIVSHRGVHLNYQQWAYQKKSVCEARHALPPQHEYIENTMDSIEAAFDFGSTIVEIDIRKTADDNLVIFHDAKLECRTDGTGRVADHPVEYLKKLDVGYGYSTDGGKTFPRRGMGVGLMPTLDEVLTKFPDQKFIIDNKDADLESIEILSKILKNYPVHQRENLYFWGPGRTLKALQKITPEVSRLFVLRSKVTSDFLRFYFSFGLIKLPSQHRDLVIGLKTKRLKLLWGWPYRFLNKLHQSGVEFYLLVDTVENAKRYKSLPVDGFVTDYIESVGRVLNS